MLEIVAFILTAIAAIEWFAGKMSKRPEASFRAASMGCGLFLAVGMTAMFIQAVTDPREEFMAALVILPWIALGVMLMVKAYKGR
jgi:uncharacterized membrane protein